MQDSEDYIMLKKSLFLWIIAILWTMSSIVFAAGSQGHLEDLDFSCKGVMLGATEKEVFQVFGEPLYDQQRHVHGKAVVYYIYDKGYEVGISVKNRCVVDFIIKDENYQARDGIRYGATPYKITLTYGKNKRQQLEDGVYYIYERPCCSEERLVLEMDDDNNFLKSFRITSLPLKEDDFWEAEEALSNDVDADVASKLDLGSYPHQDIVKIRGWEK